MSGACSTAAHRGRRRRRRRSGPTSCARWPTRGARVAAADRDRGQLEASRDIAGDAARRRTSRRRGRRRRVGRRARRGRRRCVHLVGGWRGGKPIEEAPLEDLELLDDLLFRTRRSTPRAPSRRAAGRGRHGRFALVSRAAGASAPTAGNAAYAATKAAAEAWTLRSPTSSAETGGTANVVVVNAIVTPQMRDENPDKAYKTFTDAERDRRGARLPAAPTRRAKMNGQRLRAARTSLAPARMRAFASDNYAGAHPEVLAAIAAANAGHAVSYGDDAVDRRAARRCSASTSASDARAVARLQRHRRQRPVACGALHAPVGGVDLRRRPRTCTSTRAARPSAWRASSC